MILPWHLTFYLVFGKEYSMMCLISTIDIIIKSEFEVTLLVSTSLMKCSEKVIKFQLLLGWGMGMIMLEEVQYTVTENRNIYFCFFLIITICNK